MNKLPFKLSVLICACALLFAQPAYGKSETKPFENMKARLIGPANMSGRIGDIAAVASDPDTIYIGAATGGLWKSSDGGVKWQPIFDDQPTSSIGAVAVFQANPNILWVGTGEGNPRNSSGVGRGVFKSMDAGKTWACVGLEKTEKISRIILDPHNPDMAYAAALGTTWGENPQRGVFKTTDGGQTWRKVLFVDNKTGAADLAVDPRNPNKLIAAMWQHRRWPWFFKSGGPGSGLYITGDGGQNWKKLSAEDGLPKGELGRIGVAFAHNKPEVVYALVEAEKNVLLRSEDGGFKWTTVNKKPEVSNRPFYYSDIRVHPKNENTVYSLQQGMMVSEDGGKNFKRLISWGQAHGDFQAMWIHPDGEYMIVGSDGGVVISRNGGKSWLFSRNLPIGQFYHVSYDMASPYNVYGGLQDNGSWVGPSGVLTEWGIFNYHWKRVGGGDGFDTEPDPSNPHGVYAMWQGGNLNYFDLYTGQSKEIKPTGSDVKHRYNWNAGFALDPLDKTVIYYGSQFVHRSRDRGLSWEIISPDLTGNDPEKQKQAQSGGLTPDVTAAENHTTILCIAPSPVQKGVIWVSTDDGYVQLTRDDGKTWQLVSTPLTGKKGQRKKNPVPFAAWAPHVEASKFDPAEAFVVFDDHRRANWTTYVFKTTDYGKTWKSLSTPDIDGFVHVIEQDHADKDLLFLGTEFGLFVSFNGGQKWQKWTAGLPTVPVRDISVHPRDNDLIIGTHGRSIYILDDISYLRGINDTLLAKDLHLFPVQASFPLYRRGWTGSYSTLSDGEFVGGNRDTRARFTFLYNPEEKQGADTGRDKAKTAKQPELKIEILDSSGKVVRDLKVKPKKGINRAGWDFREEGMELPKFIPYGGRIGNFLVLPGAYTVRLKHGDTEVKHNFAVKSDPRLNIDPEVLKKNYLLAKELNGWSKSLLQALKNMKKTGDTIKTVVGLCGDLDAEKKKPILEKAGVIEKALKTLFGKLMNDPDAQGILDESDTLSNQIMITYELIEDSYEPISQAAEYEFKKTRKLIAAFLDEYNKLFETEVKGFREAVEKSGVQLFKPFKPITLDAKK